MKWLIGIGLLILAYVVIVGSIATVRVIKQNKKRKGIGIMPPDKVKMKETVVAVIKPANKED